MNNPSMHVEKYLLNILGNSVSIGSTTSHIYCPFTLFLSKCVAENPDMRMRCGKSPNLLANRFV